MESKIQDVLSPAEAINQLTESQRLETFCDGVLAIAITLLVLEIKAPVLQQASAASLLSALLGMWPLLSATVLSFTIIGSYWLNHHRLMRQLNGVNHGFMLLTLLWLLAVCLIPFPTAVLGAYLLHGDSLQIAAPLYLAGLALPSLAWSFSWLYARRRGLVRQRRKAPGNAHWSGLYTLSTLAHLLWVLLSLIAPKTALLLGILQALSYLRPLHTKDAPH